MDRNEMLSQINEVFIDILDDDELVIEESTTAEDVEDWDSLTHIQLVVGIEKSFKVRFTSMEIQRWQNVGEMMTCIQEKGA